MALNPPPATPLPWQHVQAALEALVNREALTAAAPSPEPELEATALDLLTQFNVQNDDPRTSPHLQSASPSSDPDRLEPLEALLLRCRHRPPGGSLSSATAEQLQLQLQLQALRALKVLARRQDLRLRCTQQTLAAVVPLLEVRGSGDDDDDGDSGETASAAANALSNLCYEPANCISLVGAGGVAALLRLLSDESAHAKAAAGSDAAGALQTLSFQPKGRAAVLQAGGPAVLLCRLASATGNANSSAHWEAAGKLRQRLAGALHNLSSSAEGAEAVRCCGGVPALVCLLAACQQRQGLALAEATAAAAAGCLQNLTRQVAARGELRAQAGAVPALVALLAGGDVQVGGGGCTRSAPSPAYPLTPAPPLVQAAVCAAGALANLAAEGRPMGGSSAGSCGSGGGGGGSRVPEALVHALAGALAAGAVMHSLVAAASSGSFSGRAHCLTPA